MRICPRCGSNTTIRSDEEVVGEIGDDGIIRIKECGIDWFWECDDCPWRERVEFEEDEEDEDD
jgi:hypothetical protein